MSNAGHLVYHAPAFPVPEEHTMPRKSVLILSVLCAAVMFGCFKSPRTGNDNSRTTNTNSASSDPATSAEKIGIPECDEFVAKYEACITDHVPEAKQRQYRENIQAWAKVWKQRMVSSTPRDVVVGACKNHIIASRESMKSFGCEF
jgi:hypothetical protein